MARDQVLIKAEMLIGRENSGGPGEEEPCDCIYIMLR